MQELLKLGETNRNVSYRCKLNFRHYCSQSGYSCSQSGYLRYQKTQIFWTYNMELFTTRRKICIKFRSLLKTVNSWDGVSCNCVVCDLKKTLKKLLEFIIEVHFVCCNFFPGLNRFWLAVKVYIMIYFATATEYGNPNCNCFYR